MPGMLELIGRIGYWEAIRGNSIVVRSEGKEVFVEILAPTGEKLDRFDMWPDGFVSEMRGSAAFGSFVSQVYPMIPEWTMVAVPKVGRNDPCRCGSGKKYKKCCGHA